MNRKEKRQRREAAIDVAIRSIEESGTMRCVGPCGLELPATETFFRRNEANRNGFRLDCRDCERQADRDRKRRLRGTHRLCRECGETLAADEFGSSHLAICRRCENPF